jgi:hypothetical protein
VDRTGLDALQEDLNRGPNGRTAVAGQQAFGEPV